MLSQPISCSLSQYSTVFVACSVHTLSQLHEPWISVWTFKETTRTRTSKIRAITYHCGANKDGHAVLQIQTKTGVNKMRCSDKLIISLSIQRQHISAYPYPTLSSHNPPSRKFHLLPTTCAASISNSSDAFDLVGLDLPSGGCCFNGRYQLWRVASVGCKHSVASIGASGLSDNQYDEGEGTSIWDYLFSFSHSYNRY